MQGQIIKLGDNMAEILRQVAKEVDIVEAKDVQDDIDKMLSAMMSYGAAGIAAPQLGIQKRIFTLYDGTVCINPEYIFRSGKITSRGEGCLSVGEKRFNLKRSRTVKIRFFDRDGKSQELKPRNKLLNIAIQHEMDHLDGVLICDKGLGN